MIPQLDNLFKRIIKKKEGDEMPVDGLYTPIIKKDPRLTHGKGLRKKHKGKKKKSK